MPPIRKPQLYRDAIDSLVVDCRSGQGQIGPNRVRSGLWNPNASTESMPDQTRINELLGRLPQNDRDLIAQMLNQEYVGGAFAALRILNDFGVEPFQDGYEGAAYNDFVGRLDDWSWPNE